MVRVINNVWLFFVAASLLVSCKKNESDTAGPTVDWQAPSSGSDVYSVDTIGVQAVITDDENITRVSVKLTDGSGLSFATMGDVFPESTSYSLNKAFIVDRPDLEGGPMFLHLEAWSSENKTSVFRDINVWPVPWEVRHVAVAYGSSSNRSVAIREDESWTPVLNNGGDIQMLLANHFEDLILSVSGESGKVQALSYPDYNEEWSYEIPNNTNWRSIESASLNQSNGELVLGDTDQLVYILNKEGQVNLTFDTELIQHQPVKALHAGSRIYLVERKIDNSNQEFSSFFRSSGALNTRVYLPGEVVELFEQKSSEALAEHDEVAVFVNDNNQPRLRIFERYENGFTDPINLPGEEISAVCKIGQKRYLFQIDGVIYHYNFSGPLGIYLNSSTVFEQLIYNPVNDRVLGVSEDGVTVMGFGGSGLQVEEFWSQSNSTSAVVLRNR